MSSRSQRLNQQRFSRTAELFAASAAASKLSPVDSLVELVGPSREDLVLDVACGPGRLLAVIAPRVRFAAGVDLTFEMLKIAQGQAGRRQPGKAGRRQPGKAGRRQPGKAGRRQPLAQGTRPLGLVLGEGERLPFRDGSFTLVTTTLAIHHYEDPGRVVAEMVRVCRPGGKVAVADIVGAADDAKRALANAIERLRDPAHVETLSAAGLEVLLTSRGLAVTGRASGSVIRELEEWCRISGTPPELVPRVRAMLLDSRPGDLAGMAPVLHGQDVQFRHDWVVLVCRKP
jgi:ubiquinone/menaquinone biosynthesis C-methylase UbiE